MRKINREIYFYEVVLEKYDDDTNSFKISENYREDIKDLFNIFKDLPCDKENLDRSRYSKKQNGTYDFVNVDTMSEEYIEGKLINSDDSGLTYYEEKGEIKFLKDTISKNASIAEVSHFVFCLDTKILAFEYNAKSSHSPSLVKYIYEKTNSKYSLTLKNLVNPNKEKRFNAIKQVKSFKFTTSSKYLLSSNAASNKGFFKAASAALDLTKRETDVEQKVTIEIKPGRITKKNKRPYYDAEELKSSINELIRENPDADKSFKLDIVGINELNERIMVNYSNDILTKRIILEPTEIESKYFYKKIKDVYNKTIEKIL